MANQTRTLAQLIGGSSTARFGERTEHCDRQLFAFPGLDGEYVTHMGRRAPMISVVGLLRSAGKDTDADATNDLHKILYTITANSEGLIVLQKKGIIFDLFGGETTRIAKLYFDTTGASGTTEDTKIANLIVAEFKETTSRHLVGAGAGNIRCIVNYAMTLMKVGP